MFKKRKKRVLKPNYDSKLRNHEKQKLVGEKLGINVCHSYLKVQISIIFKELL
jgi:hypothetical protein